MRILNSPTATLLLLISSLLSAIEVRAQGILGRRESKAIEEANHSDRGFIDLRNRILKIPNLSNPPCTLEVNRTPIPELASDGLQIISSFKISNDMVAVIGQITKDKTARYLQARGASRERVSLFADKEYVFSVRFSEGSYSGNRDKYVYKALDPKFGRTPGVAYRKSDEKLVLLSDESDLRRLKANESSLIEVLRYPSSEYRNTVYAKLRKAELESYQEVELGLVEDDARRMGKDDSDLKEILSEKIRNFKIELKACAKQ